MNVVEYDFLFTAIHGNSTRSCVVLAMYAEIFPVRSNTKPLCSQTPGGRCRVYYSTENMLSPQSIVGRLGTGQFSAELIVSQQFRISSTYELL